MENAYRLAILLEIGNIPHYILQATEKMSTTQVNEKIRVGDTFSDVDLRKEYKALAEFDLKKLFSFRLERLVVSRQTMEFVLKMYDRIYLHHVLSITESLFGDSDNGDNDVQLMVEKLRGCNKINKVDLFTMLYQNGIKWCGEEIKPEDIEKASLEIDDTDITVAEKKDITHKFGKTPEKRDAALKTLEECGCLAEIRVKIAGSRKPTTLYIYNHYQQKTQLPITSDYSEHKGDGKYESAMEISRINPAKVLEEIERMRKPDNGQKKQNKPATHSKSGDNVTAFKPPEKSESKYYKKVEPEAQQKSPEPVVSEQTEKKKRGRKPLASVQPLEMDLSESVGEVTTPT
jgi:hypothetical protein